MIFPLWHHGLGQIMEDLRSRYNLKGDFYSPLDQYLGANSSKYQLNNRLLYWSMYPGNYIKEDYKIVKRWSKEEEHTWTRNQKAAISANYSSEIDILDKLDEKLANPFQLWWAL